MITLQQIISEETDNMVRKLDIGDNNWIDIENELMTEIKRRVMYANLCLSKGEPRLTMPKFLTFGQIAEILNATFIIRVILNNKNNKTGMLGVYDKETGIYDTDLSILFRAAIKLRENLTRHCFREVTNRLLLICKTIDINNDKDLFI